MILDNQYELKQTVYLVTDTEQLPRLVTGIIVREGCIVYELACGSRQSEHFQFEICEAENIVAKR